VPRRLWMLILPAALLASACGGASDSHSDAAGASKGGTTLSLVAYSTPQVVYDEVIPAFTQTAQGEGVGFRQSYGASGDQSRAVENGQAADIVAFSLAPDVDRLVKAAWSPRTGRRSRTTASSLTPSPC
jgi:ABC-type sulfate transport system substrate-binding protein